MKKASFILSIVAIVGVAALAIANFCCCPKAAKDKECCEACAAVATGKIVYFNLDRVLVEYKMSEDLGAKFNTKAQGIEQEILRKRDKLEADMKAFQEKIDKGLVTRSVAEAQAGKLQERQDEYNAFAQSKQNELAEEQQVMVNNIADAVKKFVDTYAAENGYDMVLTTQGGILPAPVAYGAASLDITDALLAALNAAYSK